MAVRRNAPYQVCPHCKAVRPITALSCCREDSLWIVAPCATGRRFYPPSALSPRALAALRRGAEATEIEPEPRPRQPDGAKTNANASRTTCPSRYPTKPPKHDNIAGTVAEAMRAYARQSGDVQLQNWAAEIRVRAAVRAGELLREMKERGEVSKGQGEKLRSQRTTLLPDLGITRDQSSKHTFPGEVPRSGRLHLS